MADEPINKPGENSLAARIISEREKRGWSQKTLIEKTGLRPRIVYDTETGEPPTIETLEILAKAFGTTVEKLTRGADRTRFLAPLGKSVKIIVLVTTILIIAATFLPLGFFILIPYAIYAGCFLESIQSYAIEGKTLVVNRLLWKTRIPLDGLKMATAEKNAMKGSLRLFGNGGLFVYAGWFKNASLGSFRACATDTGRTVVLKFAEKTVVVSPDDPEAFVRALRCFIKA
jgi:transcriptional regulator with XRE-family HTH domain